MGVKTPDGYLFNVSFEQRAPQVGGAKSFSNSLEHAKSKRADIAVVYDRNKVYNRKEVEDGIRRYEQYNAYRFKRIIVVSARGNVLYVEQFMTNKNIQKKGGDNG